LNDLFLKNGDISETVQDTDKVAMDVFCVLLNNVIINDFK